MMTRKLLFAATFCLAASLSPAQAQTTNRKVAAELADYRTDAEVKLVLLDHENVRGSIVAVGEDSVSILPKHGTTPQTVAFTDIRAVRDRSSLGSRFQMGPCIGPITLIIAAPFITARYLAGH